MSASENGDIRFEKKNLRVLDFAERCQIINRLAKKGGY
jgi:hypothetical protein